MKHKKILLLAYFAAFVVTIVAGLEVYLRFNHDEVLKTQVFPLIYQPDSLNGYSYIPGISSTRISPSYEVTVVANRHGFFGDDFLAEKANAFRIIIVSYSIESGGGYVKQLRDEFEKRGFSNIELINCSIDGAGLNWHHYRMIKTKLLRYRPDLVIFNTEVPFTRIDCVRECYKGYVLQYSPGSVESRQLCIDAVDEIHEHEFLTGLYDKSYVVRAACKIMVDRFEYDYGSLTQRYIAPYRKKKTLSGDFKEYNYTVDETLNYLGNLSDTLNTLGGRLVLFDHFQGSKPDSIISQIKKRGIGYINLDIEWDVYEAELALEHDSHPSQKGYEEMSRRFFKCLTARNETGSVFIPGKLFPSNWQLVKE